MRRCTSYTTGFHAPTPGQQSSLHFSSTLSKQHLTIRPNKFDDISNNNISAMILMAFGKCEQEHLAMEIAIL